MKKNYIESNVIDLVCNSMGFLFLIYYFILSVDFLIGYKKKFLLPQLVGRFIVLKKLKFL